MKITLGLTGPTGAGKSTAALFFSENGFKVIDCDLVAREVTQQNSPALKSLCKVFGDGILDDNGALNRKKLAAIAFSTPEKTELLNNTVLPFISEAVLKEAEGSDAVLLDAPTLFESGLDRICDKTICVFADEKLRLSRITERDGISLEEALLRMSAGKKEAYYKERVDFFLMNNGDGEQLRSQLSHIYKSLSEV